MGLLDFLNTPQGQALASGVATYAATARRGTPVNNIGRGLLGGVQGYQNAIDAQRQAKIDAQKEAYNNQMMQYNTTQAETARMKAESERRKLLQQQESERANSKMLMPGFLRTAGFQGQGFDIDESGELVPSEQVVMQPVSANLDFLTDAGDEYKAMIAQGLQSPDLAVRKQAMNEAFRYYRDSRKTTKEAKDAIAKERAMAEAMGMDVGDLLRQRMNKSGVNVTVQNYGEPKPVQMPDGSQALVRFGKDVNAPPVLVPFMPAASDTEQMTAGYADRMINSERVLNQIGDKGNPTYTTAIVGGVAGEAGRSVISTAEQQMHRQAQEDWVRAKLRKESGAVIAEEEMEREIKTYFPMPWDKPETIKQKARARQIAIESMKKTAGPAMPKQNQKAPTAQSKQPANPVQGKPTVSNW